MKKLELELKLKDCTLIMKVLHQHESLRGNGTLYERDGYTLVSQVCPAIPCNTCYIRGKDRERDNETVAYTYASEKECIAMYNFILEAQDHINEESNKKKEEITNSSTLLLKDEDLKIINQIVVPKYIHTAIRKALDEKHALNYQLLTNRFLSKQYKRLKLCKNDTDKMAILWEIADWHKKSKDPSYLEHKEVTGQAESDLISLKNGT